MISVAIDGPAGAGKSSIAKAVAKELNYIYIDTGALYRAIGLYAVEQAVTTTNREAVAALLSEIDVTLQHIHGHQHVFLNGVDVSERIRKPVVTVAASHVSAHPEVRTFFFFFQRKLAEENNVIMDGRDIGTVILPNANVIIYLTASAEERARRRYKELFDRGEDVHFDTVLKEIQQRDYNDSHREIAPLKQAEDAILVDTTTDDLEAAIQKVKAVILSKIS